MAPVATPPPVSLPHDLYLILTFPSFASLSTVPPTSYLPTIASAARRSTSLLILVRFSLPNTSPWSSTSSTSTSSATGGSSVRLEPIPASSTTPPVVADGMGEGGGGAWETLETFLARAYSAATKVFLNEDRVLANVDVVIEEMRGLRLCVPDGVEVQRVEVEEGSGEVSGKGKGREESNGDARVVEGEALDLYDVVALGGTFDHLHAGHKILLGMAASVTERRLIVGVTDEALLVNKKYHEQLQPLDLRIECTRSFLELIRPGIEHDVVPIQDPYGPTANDPTIKALVVSDETRAGGDAVNKKREENSLSILDIKGIELIADDADSEGKGGVTAAAKMGSTGIRKWLSERGGKL